MQVFFSLFFKKSKITLDILRYPCYYMQAIEIAHAPVAQLDRVTDYESVGQGFESLPAYQKNGKYQMVLPVFLCVGRTRKGGTSPQTGVKIESWRAIFSPWESPAGFRCIPWGCRWNLLLHHGQKCKRVPSGITLPQLPTKNIPFSATSSCFFRQVRL